MFRPNSSESDTEAQVGFLFHVLIGLDSLGEFRAVRGIGRTVQAEEIPEGGRNHSPHWRVGRSKYTECKIEWGMSNRLTLFDWIHAVEAGYAYKRQVWVIQLTRDRMPMRIYQLWDAWPVSWEGARLDANENVVDTEEITIAYEAVTMINIPSDLTLDLNLPDLSFIDGFGSADQSIGGDEQQTGAELAPVQLTAEGEEGEEGEEGDEAEDDPATEEGGPVDFDKESAGDSDAPTGPKVSFTSKPADPADPDDASPAASPSHPASPPIKLSGGMSFAATVFEPVTLGGEGAADDAAADDGAGAEEGKT